MRTPLVFIRRRKWGRGGGVPGGDRRNENGVQEEVSSRITYTDLLLLRDVDLTLCDHFTVIQMGVLAAAVVVVVVVAVQPPMLSHIISRCQMQPFGGM